eukprot:3155225-Amphidinium_carterae.1
MVDVISQRRQVIHDVPIVRQSFLVAQDLRKSMIPKEHCSKIGYRGWKLGGRGLFKQECDEAEQATKVAVFMCARYCKWWSTTCTIPPLL